MPQFPRAKDQERNLVVLESSSGDIPALAEGDPADAIRAELKKILASPQFIRSERLSQFLRYVVGHALLGKSDELTEYNLAVEVYRRRPSFDPQVDSIVRVEAARLRSKLEEYYQTSGLSDRVLITIPKRSYAPVFRTRDAPAAPVTHKRSWIRLPRLLEIGVLAVVLVLVGIGTFSGLGPKLGMGVTEARLGPQGPAGGARDITSLAVLPLVHLCPDNEHEFFSDGLTEELIEELAHVPGLRVVSRTSSFYFKGKTDDIRKIGRQLSVGTVLEGSVRTAGNKLRITAQVVNVADGYQLWSQVYDRDISDLFGVQREIAAGVANALRLQLAGGSLGWSLDRPTRRIEAYNLYLKGRYFVRKWGTGGLHKGLGYFEQAIEMDPEFAKAHAELAEAYCVLGIHAGIPPDEAMPKARSAALKALAIDDTLAHAHAALGLVRGIYEWDWKGAGQEFERAHALDPGDADIHEAWVMGYLAPTGGLDEALKQIQEAQVLDPVSPRIASVVGMVHYFARRYDAAIEQLRKALELDPSFYGAYLALGSAYEQKSAFDEAIAAVQKGSAAWHSGMEKSFLGHVYALMGRTAEAQALADELAQSPGHGYISPAYIAVIYAALGQRDRAFDWLEKACQRRSATLAYLKVNPRYDSLRPEPRFTALLKKVNLQ